MVTDPSSACFLAVWPLKQNTLDSNKWEERRSGMPLDSHRQYFTERGNKGGISAVAIRRIYDGPVLKARPLYNRTNSFMNELKWKSFSHRTLHSTNHPRSFTTRRQGWECRYRCDRKLLQEIVDNACGQWWPVSVITGCRSSPERLS